MRIGELLKSYRKMHRVSIDCVAKSIGVSKATLSRIENNKHVSGETIIKLMTWLMGKPKEILFD